MPDVMRFFATFFSSEKSDNFFDVAAIPRTPERVDVGRRTVSDKLRLLSEMPKTDISDKSLDFKADRTLFHQSHICRSLSTGKFTHAQAIAQPSERSHAFAARRSLAFLPLASRQAWSSTAHSNCSHSSG